MTYPARTPGNNRRVIGLDYGNNTDDFDSRLGRITRIKDAGGGGLSLGTLAAYAYAGQSRRVEQVYGGELGASVYAARHALDSSPGTVGYERLDRYGRVKDLLYSNAGGGGGATLYRALHGYDTQDQRLYTRVTQAQTPIGGGGYTPHDNDRSHLYGYDALRRLQAADNGHLDSTNTATTTTGCGGLRRSSPTRSPPPTTTRHPAMKRPVRPRRR